MELCKTALSMVLALLVTFVASEARAEPELRLSGNGEELLLIAVGVIVASPVLSLVADTINGVAWASGEQGDTGWIVAGVLLGIASAIVGGVLVSDDGGDLSLVGAAFLAHGVGSIVLGIGAAAQPAPRASLQLD